MPPRPPAERQPPGKGGTAATVDFDQMRAFFKKQAEGRSPPAAPPQSRKVEKPADDREPER
jgi:hypothetical protein